MRAHTRNAARVHPCRRRSTHPQRPSRRPLAKADYLKPEGAGPRAAGSAACPPGQLQNASAVDAAHADVLDLDVLVDPVLGTLTADSRLLDAAEGRDLGRD